MLGDRIGVADAIPLLRKKVPQADADHPVSFCQRTEHAAPDAEIVERAVYAEERRSAVGLSHIEIGHVVCVDVEGLHGRADGVRKVEPVVQRFPESGWFATFSKPRFGFRTSMDHMILEPAMNDQHYSLFDTAIGICGIE